MSSCKNHLSPDDYLFLDKFIGVIAESKSGFDFCPMKSQSIGLPHKYELPYIGISEEEPISDCLFDGFLGVYSHGDKETINREGKIVLYRKNIEKTAFDLSFEKRLDFNLAYSLLFKIVLAHEISHWMFHYSRINCSDNNCNTQDGINKLYANVNSDLHEYIAQKMTREIFKINPLFELSFNWLLENQKEPYTVNIDEGINKIAAFKYFLNYKSDNNNVIQDALNNGGIDYHCFKTLLDKKNGAIHGKRYGI